jgi:copper(I)-binding protein
VEKAWIRAAPPAATVYAGYALVRNDCREPFELTGIKSRDFVMAQVHETKIVDGDSTMRRAKLTVLPAHSLLRFEPGARHFMLMHPRRMLPEGSVVRLELLLADGRRIPADFTVRRDAPR